MNVFVLDGAAEAAVSQFEPFLEQLPVVAHGHALLHCTSCKKSGQSEYRAQKKNPRTFAEFIENDGDLLRVLLRENIIEQGGFA